MTLTEFLLARIAEDEAAAADASEVGVQFKVRSYGNGLHDLWDDDWLGGVRIDTTRLLAECGAKRRIVARHSACDDVSYGDTSTCPDLRDLAAVYSDHPDYDEEWRP